MYRAIPPKKTANTCKVKSLREMRNNMRYAIRPAYLHAAKPIVIPSRILASAFLCFCGMLWSVIGGVDIIGGIRRFAFLDESRQGIRLA